MANSESTKWVHLGDYIEEYDERVGDYHIEQVYGLHKDFGFIPTVANMTEIDTSKYKLVPKHCFACNFMHVGRDVTIPIAYNLSNHKIAVSPAYYIFRVRDNKREDLDGDYLKIFFSRLEFGRKAWFYTDNSIRGNIPEKAFGNIKIPLPSIDVQRELVTAYKGLKELAEQNEALLTQLSAACQAYIVDCRAKYESRPIGQFIDIYHIKNSDCSISLEQGININKEFISPQRPNSDLSSRIVVRKGQFAYCTQLNNENVAIAYREGEDCVVSPVYNTFEIKSEFKEHLLPKYLFLWLQRKEFGRYVYWKSIGSAYEFLQEENLCEYEIPIPPIEVQRAIVEVYQCMERAKKIAKEARARLKQICPALIQRAAHS